MFAYRPVSCIAEFEALDESDVLLGYMAGFDGAAEPGREHTHAFFHGWRNGALDAGRRERDDADRALAAAFALRGVLAPVA